MIGVELQAAVMGSRMAQTLLSLHSLEMKRNFFWADSQTVLRWIKSDTRKYQPFFANDATRDTDDKRREKKPKRRSRLDALLIKPVGGEILRRGAEKH